MEQKLLNLFFENPIKEFYLSQISRLTKIPKTTLLRRLTDLINQKIIIKIKSEPFDKYIANEQNYLYLFHKKMYIIKKLYASSLIDYLINVCSPTAIVLFGSCAKGEYDSDSDIDICIFSNKKKLDLSKFKLNHNIQVFFFSKLSEIQLNLRQNIINGIVLFGFMK